MIFCLHKAHFKYNYIGRLKERLKKKDVLWNHQLKKKKSDYINNRQSRIQNK